MNARAPLARRARTARAGSAGAVLVLIAMLASPPSAGALTLSPLNGTPDASARTQISFLGASPAQISHLSVVGSRSGAHRGRLESYASAVGASFLPARPFARGEEVTVRAVVGKRRVGTRFTVAYPAALPAPLKPPGTRRAPAAPPATDAIASFTSEPELHPPRVQILVDKPASSPGDLFLTPAFGPGQHGPMIVDHTGQLVWFKRAPPGDVVEDLQAAQYGGQPVLTWWQGRILSAGFGVGTDEIYDSSYQPVAQLAAGNGYMADLHDLEITPQGAAFITVYSPIIADLTHAGGSRRGEVLDSIVQEVDIKTGLVMFEWHAWGHVPVSDSYTVTSGGAGELWDYFHLNSISLDPSGDGNFIVSSRNTWAAYEVSAHTGAILWRLGGKRPTFAMRPGTGFAWQHDVRWQADGTLTLFDDGSVPRVHTQSRAIRERIDWRRRAVTVVSRLVHTPAILAGSQGNDELQANGNTLIGWGEQPYLTEYSPSGEVVFDARLPPTGQSYRAYRFLWNGRPAAPPTIAVTGAGPGAQNISMSWNGATDVHAWRILAGPTPAALAPVATVASNGFETVVSLPAGAGWYAARALDAEGAVEGTSAAAHP